MNKKAKSLVAVILILLLVVSILVGVIPAQAYAIEKSQIDEIQQQKDSLSGQVAECKNRIDQLKQEQANVLQQKAAYSEQTKITNEQLALVAEEISLYDEMIEEKAEEVENAKNREADQLRRYRSRIRAMEESGGYNILAIIIRSSNFSELLTAMDDMNEIMESDKQLEREYIAAREETEAVMAEYEAVREEYKDKQDELKAERIELEMQIEAANAELENLEEEMEQALEEYEAARNAEAAAAASVADMIAQYNQQQREQAAADAANNANNNANNGGADGGSTGGTGGGEDNGSSGGTDGGSSSGGNTSTPGAGTGSFIWPVPCSTRVTSRYGYRSDPFTGKQAYHSGIDIDGFNNEGNIIVAADGGTVITAESNSGYGNYVVIDHGNYTQTLYAHMSGFAVSVGETVAQGQVVGYLGSTGRATGTHCHFEIFVNGERTDPAAYFSGLSYWNC